MAGLPLNGPIRPRPCKIVFTPTHKRSTLESSARVIQAVIKLKVASARKGVRFQQLYAPTLLERAIIIIQKVFRGKVARKRAQDVRDEIEVDSYHKKKRNAKFVFKVSREFPPEAIQTCVLSQGAAGRPTFRQVRGSREVPQLIQ
mmetsp:Transcript_15469/g.23371  ORF Transcript_15469/g.23371 Transcript_15469/m.23371 type:complete len:145 (-) Transcript_15469:232-666(-)